ncbi:MAG: hypothetical protein JHC57_08010 [Sphingopyxis sp.]|uniref:hypothetical protein n=1 Tax=Sphingopyxis sp. TaxID=1908224 RepID=UPI001A24B31C|nr:hypothetical protein [Sphingopyxis sp.]MBJ7499681.1 hypothetical protein [Sphingopyxis sp.]
MLACSIPPVTVSTDKGEREAGASVPHASVPSWVALTSAELSLAFAIEPCGTDSTIDAVRRLAECEPRIARYVIPLAQFSESTWLRVAQSLIISATTINPTRGLHGLIQRRGLYSVTLPVEERFVALDYRDVGATLIRAPGSRNEARQRLSSQTGDGFDCYIPVTEIGLQVRDQLRANSALPFASVLDRNDLTTGAPKAHLWAWIEELKLALTVQTPESKGALDMAGAIISFLLDRIMAQPDGLDLLRQHCPIRDVFLRALRANKPGAIT